MAQTQNRAKFLATSFEKTPTGIQGLDEITGGGLPKGRPTLLCGGPGSGKTLMGIAFLVQGAIQYKEPGVLISFEETSEELTQNVTSLGFDLHRLVASQKLSLDYVHIERSEIEETGEYDLEGLFVRLGHAIDSIGAKRVVLDTIESLFAGLPNPAILRAELRRLFRWLKNKGVTAIITGERGSDSLTREGLEEYVSDCVILLDHRVANEVSTRRLRIVKYRGSTHGTNEFPFLIDERGISVLPITSLGLEHIVTKERISSGIPRLDAMLGGKGYYRGSTILVSGTAGTGKTSIAAHFADAACRRGERCAFFSFEESTSQILRNMQSIGIHLEPWMKKGLLKFHTERPTLYGMEAHLAVMHKLTETFKPAAFIVDPISNLNREESDRKAMLMRLMDHLKRDRITALFTCLTGGGTNLEQTEVGISSLADTWLLLRDIEIGGERNRGMYVLKSRGMAHSNQIREFLFTDKGVDLADVYVGPSGVLTGSARLSQEARERAEEMSQRQEVGRRQLYLESKRKSMEAQIAALRSEFEAEKAEVVKIIEQEKLRRNNLDKEQKAMAQSRKADK